VKKVEAALAAGDKETATVALAAAQPEMARGVAIAMKTSKSRSKGIAARRTSFEAAPLTGWCARRQPATASAASVPS
jgi:hypothetical protein